MLFFHHYCWIILLLTLQENRTEIQCIFSYNHLFISCNTRQSEDLRSPNICYNHKNLNDYQDEIESAIFTKLLK